MQIHELNNFTGTLGSSAYLAIDDGTDTGKISSQGLLAATEARIDNIIAGPAPSAEEIVDARLGADGVTYPSLGDAIRDQFTNVKSASIQKYTIFINDATSWGAFDNDFDGLTPNRVFALQALNDTAHSPISGFTGYVLTYKFSPGGTKGLQLAYERTSKRIFVRQGISSSWGSWQEYNPTEEIVSPINSAITLLNKYVGVLNSYFVCGKNLVNPNDISNIRESSYVDESIINSLATWKSIAIPIDASKGHISLNLTSVYAMFYSSYDDGLLSTVTVPSNLTGFISGVRISSSNINERDNIAIPSNAKWVLVSCPKTLFPTLQVEYGAAHTSYEPYQVYLNNVKTVGSIEVNLTDYTNLRDCLESISPTAANPYIVNIPDGTYDIKSYYSAAEIADASFKGLFIPDYCTLRGIGSRERTILKWENSSSEVNGNISTLNIYNVAGLENLTVLASNIRYCVHDDWATSYNGTNKRSIKNCIFEKQGGGYACAYGAGMKGNAQWRVENCKFIGSGSSFRGFSVHNNTPVTIDSNIEVINCRFENTVASSQEMCFESFNTGVTAFTYIVLVGNKFSQSGSKIKLGESDPTNYGRGIKSKLTGYGNSFSNSDVTIAVTDGQDYSSYVDLV